MRPFAIALAAVAVLVLALLLARGGGTTVTHAESRRDVRPCDRFAEPGPRAVQRLVASLGRGEVGCLRSGIYRETVSIARSGVTIAGAPGARATILGRIVVRGDDVVLAYLKLNGRNPRRLPSPTVLGDRVRLVENEITNANTAICVIVGSVTDRVAARGVVIERNRIHHCGRLPPTNHDHGIYVEKSRNARIVDNVIYRNADRGIQLYPDADGTLVARNVIDRNGSGVIISGDHGHASGGNRIVGNVIKNNRRNNVESWWPRGNPVGRDNVVAGNCLWGGSDGGVGPTVGFVARDNVVADPEYAAPVRGDFRVVGGGECAGKGPR